MCFRTAAWAAGYLATLGVVCCPWTTGNCAPNQDPPAGAVNPGDKTTRNRDSFVGDRVCAGCHGDVAAHYRRTPMSRSLTVVTSTIPADLSQPGTVSDPNGPYTYRVRVEKGRLIQEESLTAGDLGHRLRRTADYIVGSGHHARTMISAENGYLSQLPLAWFAREGKWKLNPGYELKNHRFDRPILPACLACHGGYAPHRSPSRNRYKLPVTSGIRCEHCHGPGKEHVSFQDGDGDTGQDPIINPKHLSPRLANDVCLQCHLSGDIVVYQPGAGPYSFRPGEKLSNHRLDFLIQTKDPQTFGVASHGSRMMRSRCYTANGGKLTCIQCHDPHRAASAFPATFYDAKCASCHIPASCDRILKKDEVKNATGCVNCHMLRRKTREGQHLVFTDHWIRVPPKQKRPDTVPGLLKPNSNVTLIGMWPKADPHQARLGTAYVKLHESMGPQFPALRRGTALLEGAIAKTPHDADVRYWLASGQIVQYRSESAVRHLRRLLRERPKWQKARFHLAVAYHQLKRYPEAIIEYERIIREVPDWTEPYPLVVRLHLSMRNTDSALRLLKRQLSYRADATAYLSLALAKHLKGEPLAECLPPIKDSLRLNPRNATAFTTRAYILTTAGEIQKARVDYRTALKIDPENREARAGLRALGPTR